MRLPVGKIEQAASTKESRYTLKAEIDELAIEYRAIEAQIDEWDKQDAERKAPLLTRREQLQNLFRDVVRQFGSAHAEKSKIMHGVKFEIMATHARTPTLVVRPKTPGSATS